jgi:hypothetical protein
VLASSALLAADVDLDALLVRLARPAPDTTGFVEVRYSSLVDAPLVVSGQLEHRKDGSLVRRVESPYQEVTELQGENVSVTRAGSKPRHFSLDRAPQLRGMLASFGALLAGDRQQLDRYFTVTARGTDTRWDLVLTPRDATLKKRLTGIVVNGSEGRARCFALQEPDGDETLMTLGVTSVSDLPKPPDRQALGAWCTSQDGR